MSATTELRRSPVNGNGTAAQVATPATRVLAQYVRDSSFQNHFAKNGFASDSAPEITVKVSVDARKRNIDKQYEVITKLRVVSKSREAATPLYDLELEYAGVFQVRDEAEERLHPYLMVECPKITFPYLQQIAAEMVRNGGFPALRIDNVDFSDIYRRASGREHN